MSCCAEKKLLPSKRTIWYDFDDFVIPLPMELQRMTYCHVILFSQNCVHLACDSSPEDGDNHSFRHLLGRIDGHNPTGPDLGGPFDRLDRGDSR